MFASVCKEKTTTMPLPKKQNKTTTSAAKIQKPKHRNFNGWLSRFVVFKNGHIQVLCIDIQNRHSPVVKTKGLFEEFVESRSNILNLNIFNLVRILSIKPEVNKIVFA